MRRLKVRSVIRRSQSKISVQCYKVITTVEKDKSGILYLVV